MNPSPQTLHKIADTLKNALPDWEKTSMYPYHGNPFWVLIAGMLSTQTREEATATAAEALFALADTPAKMQSQTDDAIRDAIRPVSFYNQKVGYIRDICQKVLENGGNVPADIATLMTYKGIGYKVAVLVRAAGHGIPDMICVDTHVARISARLGLIDPALKDARAIDTALRQVLPELLWADWNALMVAHGRAWCVARRPQCQACPVSASCSRVGV